MQRPMLIWFPKKIQMNNKKIEFKKFLPGIAWFFIVSVLVFMPGDEVPGTNWLDDIHFDKIVHIGIFALLTYLFSWPYLLSELSFNDKLNRFGKIAWIFIVWGIAVEIIQKYFAYHRSFDLADWAADCLGVLLAVIYLKYRARMRES